MQNIKTEVLVLGGGPGGYSAAFRAADLGKKVVIIEQHSNLGGVCLNVGCIPSKALLHVAKIINDAQTSNHGIKFNPPEIDLEKLRAWKDRIVNRLTTGLKILAKQRRVDVIKGFGKFISNSQIEIQANNEKIIIEFQNAIIAAGSSPAKPDFIPDHPNIWDSTAALSLKAIPKKLLIIGGGIIGLEMATVYQALGSKISVVEFMDQLAPGIDKDIIKPLHQYIAKKYDKIMLSTKVQKIEVKDDTLFVTFEGQNAPQEPLQFDAILVSVGRKPNGKLIGAETANIKVDDKGFIAIDNQMRTNISNIFAIGDIVGNPMLAHKAVAEGRLASEVIAGSSRTFNAKCIPAVAYTDPEIATVGITEIEAEKKGVPYGKGVFPWIASGRALSMERSEGLTKILFDKATDKIIGAAIVGQNAGELIAELGLAIEKGCTATDIALTIHPHPTLSETVMMAAEVFEKTVTDLYMPVNK